MARLRTPARVWRVIVAAWDAAIAAWLAAADVSPCGCCNCAPTQRTVRLPASDCEECLGTGVIPTMDHGRAVNNPCGCVTA